MFVLIIEYKMIFFPNIMPVLCRIKAFAFLKTEVSYAYFADGKTEILLNGKEAQNQDVHRGCN